MRPFVLLAAAGALLAAGCTASTEQAQQGSAQPPSARTQPAPASTVPVRAFPARPGETCANYHSGCLAWCAKNMRGQQGCLDHCRDQLSTCQGSGQWPMDGGNWIVTGLPPG